MTFNPKWIVGKTIARVDMRPFDRYEQKRGKTFDPVIRFTDGSTLRFVVEETEGSEYGIAPCYTPKD